MIVFFGKLPYFFNWVQSSYLFFQLRKGYLGLDIDFAFKSLVNKFFFGIVHLYARISSLPLIDKISFVG